MVWAALPFEQPQRDFLKRVLGLRSSCPTYTLMWETGRFPVLHASILRLLSYHNRVMALPTDRLLRRQYLQDLEDPKAPLRQFLKSLQLEADLARPIPLETIRDSLHHSYSELLIAGITGPTAGSHHHTYASWKSPFGWLTEIEPNPSFSISDIRTLARFRLSCHSLPVVTGAWAKPLIPRAGRCCPHCPGIVGDEDHFLFHCPHITPARLQFPELPYYTKDRRAMSDNPYLFARFLRHALPLGEHRLDQDAE